MFKLMAYGVNGVYGQVVEVVVGREYRTEADLAQTPGHNSEAEIVLGTVVSHGNARQEKNVTVKRKFNLVCIKLKDL